MTEPFPLFLTYAAKEGSTLPSHLFNKQMHILLGSGVSWDRLNPNLRAAHFLGYYLGNVRNGGHSQFMGNARNYYDGDPKKFLDWAMEAAERYGMPETLRIMRDVQAWMAENPDEAATQTGFTPHVSPALKPYDTALFNADTLDEATWLARVNTLPEAHAQTFLHMKSYKEGYVQFPAIFSEIEELRLLVSFAPVVVVADDTFEEEVKAAVAADPDAKVARLTALLADMRQALPKPAICAALSLFTEGAHLPPMVVLRAGAAKTRQPKRQGILTTARGEQSFVIEIGKQSLSVFEATGDPDAILERAINFPVTPDGLFSRLFYFVDPKRRAERAFNRLTRQKAIRKTRRLGKVANARGEEIAAFNQRAHLPEALALWLEEAQCSSAPAKWRLDLIETDCIHWQFEVGDTRLSVIASTTEVRISTNGAELVYQHEDLNALRQSIEGAN